MYRILFPLQISFVLLVLLFPVSAFTMLSTLYNLGKPRMIGIFLTRKIFSTHQSNRGLWTEYLFHAPLHFGLLTISRIEYDYNDTLQLARSHFFTILSEQEYYCLWWAWTKWPRTELNSIFLPPDRMQPSPSDLETKSNISPWSFFYLRCENLNKHY